MKAFVALLVLVVAATAMKTATWDMFDAWASKWDKVYMTEAARQAAFDAFSANYLQIQRLNAEDGSAEFGLNMFSDMAPEEFARTHLNLKTSQIPISSRTKVVPSNDPLPDNFDWLTMGAVTPVKDQGQCGSCWAFSAVANIEAVWFLKSKQLVSFSESQLVDCDHECTPPPSSPVCDGGCNGGLMMNAFQYAIKNGMDTEADYPYKPVAQTCQAASHTPAAHFTSSIMLEKDENKMQQWIYTNGPLSVAVDATYWSSYMSGIYDSSCSSTRMNHGVTCTGWGVTSTGTKYWIIKNSWGLRWGQKGYMWLARGKNKCGINQYACSIVV